LSLHGKKYRLPDELTGQETKCTTSYKEECREVPRHRCDTSYQQLCETNPKANCHTVVHQQCQKYPRELCTTNYEEKCHTVPYETCKKVKSCVKVPEEKCWPSPEKQCKKVPRQVCRQVAKHNCWKVAIKKNRYVKRKSCQKCHRGQEKHTVPKQKSKCTLVPRQACRTVHNAVCRKEPYDDCYSFSKEECGFEKQCRTEQQTKCEKAKPEYNSAPTYAPSPPTCKQVPVHKCWQEKKCKSIPQQKCSTKYTKKCYPAEKCETVKDKHCTPYTVNEVVYKEKRTCYWPPQRHADHFCTRRSDDDVLLDAGTEYRTDVEYLGAELLDQIDFLNVFPADYRGSPNETLPAGVAAGAHQSAWRGSHKPFSGPAEDSLVDTGNIDYTSEEKETEPAVKKDSVLSGSSTTVASAEDLPSLDGSSVAGHLSRDDDQGWKAPIQNDQPDASLSAPTERDDWAAIGGGDFAPNTIASFFQAQLSQGFRNGRRLNLGESVPAKDGPAAGTKALLEEPKISTNGSLGSLLWGRLVG
jgi:hypothetical protein